MRSNAEMARILQNVIDEAEEGLNALEAKMKEAGYKPDLSPRRADIAEAVALVEELNTTQAEASGELVDDPSSYDPSTWGPREVIGDLINHLASRSDMRDFPRCLARAREVFAELAARPAPTAEKALVDVYRPLLCTGADCLETCTVCRKAGLVALSAVTPKKEVAVLGITEKDDGVWLSVEIGHEYFAENLSADEDTRRIALAYHAALLAHEAPEEGEHA